MAIVKILPPPKMTVGDYRNAALRHFNTCKVLWRYISLNDGSNLKKMPEEDILKNIFYLTGYIAECAIKYRYLTDCHSLGDTQEESHWALAPEKMRRHLTFVLTSPRDKGWSEQVITGLCSSTTARTVPVYLQILGQVIPSTVVSSVEEEMQSAWEPTTRYHYATNGLLIPPNKADIAVFYQATKSLLHSLAII